MEDGFVLVPRLNVYTSTHVVKYRRPGSLVYRLFAALIGEYDVEETTTFTIETEDEPEISESELQVELSKLIA